LDDGYYLSTYLTPPGLAYVIRMWLRHDNNVSLWEKSGSTVRLLRHWELERLTGVKHDGSALMDQHELATLLDALLAGEGLSLDDVNEIWGTPGTSTVGDDTSSGEHPDIAGHSMSHLMSAMLMDTDLYFDGEVLGLAVDGAPDHVLERRVRRYQYAGGVVRGGRLEVFPVESPAMLYAWARRLFDVLEGTLMALATASLATCPPVPLPPIQLDGRRAPQLARRAVESLIADVRERRHEITQDPRFTDEENFLSAVMKEIQRWCVTIMERNIERILAERHVDPARTHLALGGGFALNCPANSALWRKYGFRGLVAPPCVNDSGQSIGIALNNFRRRLGGRFSFRFPGAYLGREDATLDLQAARHREFIEDVAEMQLGQVVRDIVEGPIAWYDGRSEVGPRALGHRSLLADPRSADAKARLNEVKQRKWWRPVAPIVLEEQAGEWFEDATPSPYMLETRTIRAARRGRVPAIAHLDESARLQTLGRHHDARLHAVLDAFHERTGVPMLCNTSLNDREEPIVDTIAEAMNFCLRKRVRVAYINGRRVAFRRFDSYPHEQPLPRGLDLPFAGTGDRRTATAARLNPHDLADRYLYAYLHNPELRERFDVQSATDAERLRRTLDMLFQMNPQRERDILDRLDRRPALA
jgi:hypothetical protein